MRILDLHHFRLIFIFLSSLFFLSFLVRLPTSYFNCLSLGCKFGRSVELWTPEHLAAQAGDKPVSLHVAADSNLDFLHRNYRFELMPFAEAVAKVFASESSGEQFYMRTLGENARKEVSDIAKSFPTLASEFQVPEFMPPEVSCRSRYWRPSKSIE